VSLVKSSNLIRTVMAVRLPLTLMKILD